MSELRWCAFVTTEVREGRLRAENIREFATELEAKHYAYQLLGAFGAGCWGRVQAGQGQEALEICGRL